MSAYLLQNQQIIKALKTHIRHRKQPSQIHCFTDYNEEKRNHFLIIDLHSIFFTGIHGNIYFNFEYFKWVQMKN